MTTYSILLRVTFSLLFSFILLSIGCQHGDENPESASYRIIEMKFYEGGVLTAGAYYNYEGEKLSVVTSYSDDFQDTATSVFEYPDENSIVWSDLTPLIKIECFYQDGKMTQFKRSQFNDNSWEILEKLTYQYTGGNLIEENWEGTIYGEYRPFEKFTYTYEGNMVIQAISYYYDYQNSNWIIEGKDETIYTGNSISKINHFIYFYDSYVESYYTDLQYNGSLLTSARSYISSTNELMDYYIYTYDDHGNMITRESNDGPGGNRIECFYEPGKGNLRQIQKPGGGIKFYLGFPMPN